MKQADTKLAKAIRELQNEVEEKTTLLEALRESYNPEDIDYYSYLKTQAWEDTRQKIFRRDGYKCVVCGEAMNLSVHHITYENLGAEKESDLVTLCCPCHEKVHAGDTVKKQLEDRKNALDQLLIEIEKEKVQFAEREKALKIEKFMNKETQKLFAYAIALGDDYSNLEDDYKIDSTYLDETIGLYGFVDHLNNGNPVDEYEWLHEPPICISSLPNMLDEELKNDKERLMFEYKHQLGLVSMDASRHFLNVAIKRSEIPQAKAKYQFYTKLAYKFWL